MNHARTRSRIALLGLLSAAALGIFGIAQAEPVHYLNIQTINPEARDGFIKAMRNNATQSRTEAANRVFDVADIGGNDPTLVLFESWRDADGYQQHEVSAHVAPVLALVPSAFAKPERKYVLRDLQALPAPARTEIESPTASKNVVARFSIKPDQRDAFVNQARSAIEQARQQPGNLVFNVYGLRDDDNAFVIYERWKDAAAYQQFHAQLAGRAFDRVLGQLQAGAPEVLVLQDRILD
ncbi:quinol monooxygenase YgiN [Pseudomonas sp. Y3 TE3536]